ncbi:dihydrodipicolinate synthase family protein [Falsiroseomonas bella]|uniref:Dihydrodipicolinate synthase family protein n=1 Tax=Falsiroseomonas bella TaxID=2184016 RepID=A0A317FDD8_9PROT|nr:dihydrodipicolinate synthase family protein [Falsiroseomonas bella]PWS37101.1 dihydrodipicolinate synthase family protein [Falsiroseomonas bella]
MIPKGPTRFHGIYPSTVLPMTRENFAPDWEAYARHTAHCVLRPGIAGVLMNGHAGENFLLSRAEKRRAVEVAVETVGGSHIVVAGVNAESSLEAAEEARDARAAGADAIMVFLPNGFALAQTMEMALLHHRTILDAVPGMPTFLFAAHHGAGRMAFTEETFAALLDLPEVVGVKEGSWEVDRYDALRRICKAKRPDVAFCASGDEHLLACMVHGSDGSLVSLADVLPDEIAALDAAVRAGDLARARALHEKLEPLAEAIYGAPPGGRATARLKFCLAEMGVIADPALRPPQPPVSPPEAAMLRQAMRSSGL